MSIRCDIHYGCMMQWGSQQLQVNMSGGRDVVRLIGERSMFCQLSLMLRTFYFPPCNGLANKVWFGFPCVCVCACLYVFLSSDFLLDHLARIPLRWDDLIKNHRWCVQGGYQRSSVPCQESFIRKLRFASGLVKPLIKHGWRNVADAHAECEMSETDKEWVC